MADPHERVAGDPKLKQMQGLARLLDDSIAIPGTGRRIGIDAIIGLIPGVGDWAGGVASAWIILGAARLGASKSTLLRMAANVLFEAVVGSIPVLGDLFDAAFKANLRNVRLIEEQLASPERVSRASRSWAIGLVVLAVVLSVALGALGIAIAVWVIRRAGLW